MFQASVSSFPLDGFLYVLVSQRCTTCTSSILRGKSYPSVCPREIEQVCWILASVLLVNKVVSYVDLWTIHPTTSKSPVKRPIIGKKGLILMYVPCRWPPVNPFVTWVWKWQGGVVGGRLGRSAGPIRCDDGTADDQVDVGATACWAD